jgi:hypothetical protein
VLKSATETIKDLAEVQSILHPKSSSGSGINLESLISGIATFLSALGQAQAGNQAFQPQPAQQQPQGVPQQQKQEFPLKQKSGEPVPQIRTAFTQISQASAKEKLVLFSFTQAFTSGTLFSEHIKFYHPSKVVRRLMKDENRDDKVNPSMYQFNFTWYIHTPKLCQN